MEDLLAEMRTPVQNPNQELLYTENIRRINGMISEANIDSLDIEAKNKNDIDTTEFDILRGSISNIACRTSTIHINLCTWRSSNTRARRQEEAIPVYTHIESSYDALNQEITRSHGTI